jgi:hypothetical protein
MKKLLAALAISAALIVPASANNICASVEYTYQRCTAACGTMEHPTPTAACLKVNLAQCRAPRDACHALHGIADCGLFSHLAKTDVQLGCGVPHTTATVAPAPAQSRREKAAKVTAPARKPKDTCNGDLTSNGCVPTPAPPPPPAINTTVGDNQVPPNANQAAPANTSPPAPSGGYGPPSADCSTITGPGMSGGGPPNCGPTGNAQPGQSGPTPPNKQPDSARQPTTQQWTPGAAPALPTDALPTYADGTPYDPSDISAPSDPHSKERCLVALQKLAPHSIGPDWLEHEMARSHCYVDGTPMSKKDQLKFELQKQSGE